MTADPGPPALARAGLDRATDRRRDPEWLADAWQRGRVLLVDDGRRALVDDGSLVLVPASAVPATGERWFLGVDADRPLWAAAADLPADGPGAPADLRGIGALLDDRDAALFTTAVALANWHAAHPHCPRCGARTEPGDGGWLRRCTAEGSEHFPRTDPAVIMLVHDGADRCLLGRQPSWPVGRYSTLAGFVEPGESLEQAVAREVAEEVGVTVREVAYVASQPWPFPSSLMLGFTAVADVGAVDLRDGEIADAVWLTRDELRAGAVKLPPPVSIAYRLISGWLGGPLPGAAW